MDRAVGRPATGPLLDAALADHPALIEQPELPPLEIPERFFVSEVQAEQFHSALAQDKGLQGSNGSSVGQTADEWK